MDPMIPLALDDGTTLRAPAYATSTLPAGVLALDPAQPNWIADRQPGHAAARALRRENAAARCRLDLCGRRRTRCGQGVAPRRNVRSGRAAAGFPVPQRCGPGAVSWTIGLLADRSAGRVVAARERFLQSHLRALPGIVRPRSVPGIADRPPAGRDRSRGRTGRAAVLRHRWRATRPPGLAQVGPPDCHRARA